MHPILVVGATGRVGRQVIAELVVSGVAVRALTRQTGPQFPWPVDIAVGDLTQPESLDAALEGVDRVFLLWTAPATAVAPAIARIARRPRHVVFLSSPHQTPHPFFQQPNPGARLHRAIERELAVSGVPWTILRPGMFATNALGFWMPQIRHGDVVRWPYAGASTAPVDVRDVATVAARVLLEATHTGRDYVLTGPQSLTQAEQVAVIGEAIGRRLHYDELPPAEARRELASTLPPDILDLLMNAWAVAVDRPAWVSHAFGELTGRPPRTFAEWARDHAEAFALVPAPSV